MVARDDKTKHMKQILKKLLPKKVRNLKHLFYAWYGAVKYQHPSEELLVIGITGTSGKSSTIFFLRNILEQAGYTVGSLSTIDFYIAGENNLNDQKMTMLGRMQNQKYLKEMVDRGCDAAIIETTSEGRVQHRHRFINYDMMVLTNLYPEHVESHGGFENYKQAKIDLFSYTARSKQKKNNKIFFKEKNILPKIGMVNTDHADIDVIKEFLRFGFVKTFGFSGYEKESTHNDTAWKVADTCTLDELHVEKDGTWKILEHGSTLYARDIHRAHDELNKSIAASVAFVLGIDSHKIEKALENVGSPPGRVEYIPEAEEHGFTVIVDYAFEPKAMNALYAVVATQKPTRIIHVFGSTGGGRDVERRFSVGKLVGNKADICIITDEDPYDDDPMEIINDVASAVEKTGKIEGKTMFKILDRKDAIQKAIDMAEEGDMVLVTGKGSEQKMCVAGGKMIEWDDREVVRDSLKRL